MSDHQYDDDSKSSNRAYYIDHQRTVTVSAPGKALIAGGYLVLEKPNIGLVIAVDKRFYATVRLGDDDGGHDEQHEKSPPLSPSISQENKDSPSSLRNIRVDIHSPQFDIILSYHLVYDTKSKDVKLKPLLSSPSQKPNPFIEKTIVCTISFLLHHNPTALLLSIPPSRNYRLLIKLRADNDFYSPIPYLQKHSLPMTPSVVSSLPPFLPCPQQHSSSSSSRPTKTGLGSSAALVTSLVGALLRFFGIGPSHDDDNNGDGERLTTTAQLIMIHNLAQTCHCLAQRKVGSGFDIAAAVYGSLTYVRWDPSLLDGLGTTGDDDESLTEMRLTEECYQRLMMEWTTDRESRCLLPLPSGVELLMADVCGGSESPSMARTILKRKESCPEVRDVWRELKRTNQQLRDILMCWSSSDDDDRSREDFRRTFRQARSLLKRMGSLADVPVEPDGQTALADATMEIPGVIVAGVPGAGGYDALFCLYMGGNEVREEIGRFWSSWEGEEGSRVVCPLAVRSGGTEGVRMEDLAWD